MMMLSHSYPLYIFHLTLHLSLLFLFLVSLLTSKASFHFLLLLAACGHHHHSSSNKQRLILLLLLLLLQLCLDLSWIFPFFHININMFPSSSSSSSFLGAMFNSSEDANTTTRLLVSQHQHQHQDSFCNSSFFNLINNNQAAATVLPPLPPVKAKKKRSLPGHPDPEAEVIALSPKTLLATNRFVCEICKKGFQRDQNLQLHRRGHNLPWKLKQRNHNKEEPIKKKAYVCPEPSCVHHHPSRALGDLTGIKKHFCRKHGEKKWKCEKCSKIYAVHSDWKAHSKTCGTREYRCDCGTLFSRKDSFITHRAFCDALAEESARLSAAAAAAANPPPLLNIPHSSSSPIFSLPATPGWPDIHIKPESHQFQIPSLYPQQPPPSPPSHHLSATALLQKAATVAATQAAAAQTQMSHLDMGELGAAFAHHRRRQDAGDESASAGGVSLAAWQKSDRLTRDFLGLTGHDGGGSEMGNGREMLGYGAGAGVGLQQYGGSDVAMLMKPQGFGYGDASGTWGDC